jgi:hypothetical protein
LSRTGFSSAFAEKSPSERRECSERESQWPCDQAPPGIGFYAAKNTAGNYCFAIGFGSSATPRLDALACQGGAIGSFPSASDPVADFSAIRATADGSTSVVTLAGFAGDDVARVAVLDRDGKTIASTRVKNNVYAADNLPQTEATAIVAYDQAKRVVYRRRLGRPPMPRPATP